MTLLKIEDAMFSFINTPEGITNLPIANTHFCRIFGSVDLRAFSPRPAPDRPADFHSRPAPRIFTLAPPRRKMLRPAHPWYFRKQSGNRQKWPKSGPEAEKRPAERPNGLLPENRSYPELPQDVGKL